MPPVPVRPKPFRTFDSFSEAVARPKTHPLRVKLDGYVDALSGSTLLDAAWTATQFAFHFSNGLWLEITLDEHDIYWSLLKSPPDFALDATSAPIHFDWGGEIGVRTENVPEYVTNRIGSEFTNLFVNDDFFYVYFRRRMILCFSTVFRTDTGEALLFISEDD